MAITLTIRDETTGHASQEFSMEVPTERLTVRELIRSRVYQEVQDFNLRRPEVFRGLVQPADAERTLNGYKVRSAKPIDWKEQFRVATESFEQNRFVILLDDKQLADLDQEIEMQPKSTVTFLRLMPLAGG
jgi:hypothetical protein